MGGREFDLIRDGSVVAGDAQDAARVRQGGVMLLPSVLGDSGPFLGRSHHWAGSPTDAGERAVAVGYYLALMTAECLSMIGAAGPSLIEGPFCANPHFLQMLATATGRPVHASAARTGTALGAAILFGSGLRPVVEADAILPDPALVPYAEAWMRAVQGSAP
jgi:sugar (pentulose or hexulose) kinase